jgi:hypothetical protein
LWREITPLLGLHPTLEDSVHRQIVAMWDVIEDPILVMRIRRKVRRIVARELRYMAENYETMPGRKQSAHIRQAWQFRRQADRFEARP